MCVLSFVALAAENIFSLHSEIPVAQKCDRYHVALHLGELKGWINWERSTGSILDTLLIGDSRYPGSTLIFIKFSTLSAVLLEMQNVLLEMSNDKSLMKVLSVTAQKNIWKGGR